MFAGVVGCNSQGASSSGGSSLSTVSSSANVATVNGTPITQADFYQQLQTYRPQQNPMGGMDTEPAGVVVLRELIQTQLLEQLAKKDGVYPADAQVDQGYQDLQLQDTSTSVKPLDQQLQEDGLSPDLVKQNQIVPQLCQLNEVSKGITVTDADVKAYYDLHKSEPQFTLPDQVHLKRIVCNTQADATALYNQLQKGGTWDAAYNSPQSVNKTFPDGDFPNWISLNNMTNPQAKPLFDALKATDAGKYAPPVKLENQFWVIQVVEKRAGQTYSLDKVSNLIKDQLLNQKAMTDPSKAGAFQAAMRDKATTADIKVNESQYQPLVQQITNPAPPAPMMAPPTPAPGGAPAPPAPKQ